MPNLGPGALGAEAGPEVLETPRLAEDAVDPRPMRGDEASRMRLAQKRPQPARARHERLETVPREVAARKRGVRGPGRPGHEEVRDLLQRRLCETAIGGDLAVVNREQRRHAVRTLERQ